MAFVALNEQSTYYFSSSFSREIRGYPDFAACSKDNGAVVLDRESRGLVTLNGRAASAEYDTSLEA
jgi:hypothetical protein